MFITLRVDSRRRAGCAAILLVTAGATVACEQPTQPEAVRIESVADITTLPAAVDCSASSIAGAKFIDVKVKLSTGAPANGAVVTIIDPVNGPACYGAAGADGRVAFSNVKSGAAVLLSVRDEVSVFAPGLEIVPPNPIAAALLADGPSLVSNRQHPTLVGGSSCSKIRRLTWPSYVELKGMPCIVPSQGLTVNVQLTGNAPTTTTRVLDASNQPLGGVIVAALSPATIASSGLEDACAVLPWVDAAECLNNSNGPALLQSVGLTAADGRIQLGVSFGSNPSAPYPLIIETIAEDDGQTLFGTLQQTASGEQLLQTSPGMCVVATVPDVSQPSGYSSLDIRHSAHSIGLGTSLQDPIGAPLAAPALVPVPGTLVVKVSIHADTKGGKGTFTMQYKLNTGGNRTIRASFAIGSGHPETCTVSGGTGNGVGGSGPAFTGHCALSSTVPADLEAGRAAYTLFFVIDQMDAERLVSAQYTVTTDHDHLDPSRSDPAYLRGAVNFTGLNATSCPVRLNNDGRWMTV